MSAWKGQLNFGLVSMPVKLKAAVLAQTFNLLHRCGPRRRSRVAQSFICKRENVAAEWDTMVKGYEYQPGRYLDVPADEIKGLSKRASRDLDLLEFVELGDLDPVLFHDSYSVIPDKDGERAFALLCEVMRTTGLAGVTRITISQRERVAVLYPAPHGGITLQTLFYDGETCRTAPEGTTTQMYSPEELQLGCELAYSKSAPWDAERYPDPLRLKLDKLVARKLRAQARKNGRKSKVTDIRAGRHRND